MEIDPDEIDGTLYRTLAAAVIPRPIGWISTRARDGTDNLAPFSFFNVVGVEPPVVMFAPVDRDDGLKDTPRNVLDTEEFVVNVVTRPVAEAMNETSATLPAGDSEFDHAGLARGGCRKVDAPRVSAADVAFECTLYDFVDVGVSSLVLGEVVYLHVDDGVTTDGKLDVMKVDAVGRLSGSYYCHTADRFSMERPP